MAYRLGDDTAKRAGRLTLNPLKHIDRMGMLMMVLFHFGWAKPVPVNMYKFRDPKKGMAITALAGPVSNFLLAVLFMVLYGACYLPFSQNTVGSYLLQMLLLGATISTGLAVFNLIPVPPLDGYRFVDQFVFKGRLSLNPQTMQIIHLVFLVLCMSGMLTGLLTTVNSAVMGALTSVISLII